MKLVDDQVDADELASLFEEWWEIWPVGAKQARKKAVKCWEKVFFKDPGVKRCDWTAYARNVLMQALRDQVNYRKAIYKKYPTPEDRKRSQIFVPHLTMPTTWLNEGRWDDHVPKMPSDVVEISTRQSCMDCPGEATILVEGNPLCAWHWTKRFDRLHLKRLAASLDKMGLARLGNESREAWSDRCREYIRGGKWAGIVKA